HQDGRLCVVQAAGYPTPSQSHFRSMDIWQAASTAETLTEGWLGKTLKNTPAGAFHVAAGNESAPLALTGSPARAPSITSIEDFQLKMAAASGGGKKKQKKGIQGAAKGATRPPGPVDLGAKNAVNTYTTPPPRP